MAVDAKIRRRGAMDNGCYDEENGDGKDKACEKSDSPFFSKTAKGTRTFFETFYH